MPLLFSYGTLQQPDVQLSTFGRLLQGRRDELPGFELDASGGVHANVVRTDSGDSRVGGTVCEIAVAELAAADRFGSRTSGTALK